MPKTEILNRLETHRNGFTSSVGALEADVAKFSQELHKGPDPWHAFLRGGFKNRFNTNFQTAAGHLQGMETAIEDFAKKVEAWKNPSLLNRIKNAPKKKKLEEDREAAKNKYTNLTNDLATLKSKWSTVSRFKTGTVDSLR